MVSHTWIIQSVLYRSQNIHSLCQNYCLRFRYGNYSSSRSSGGGDSFNGDDISGCDGDGGYGSDGDGGVGFRRVMVVVITAVDIILKCSYVNPCQLSLSLWV